MSEHTPGPWEIFTIASSAGTSFRIYAPALEDKAEAVDVAHIPKEWDGEANARLIAAAPDLLAALHRIVQHDAAACAREGLEEFRELQVARAAIAKSEGRSAT